MASAQRWKRDEDKDPVHLLPVSSLLSASRVFGHGAAKYAPWSWAKVDDWGQRYYASTLRHLFAWARGEQYDKESGLSHLSHALTNLMIMVALEEEGTNEEAQESGSHS